jgi:hypothetical protein
MMYLLRGGRVAIGGSSFSWHETSTAGVIEVSLLL